MSKLLSLLLLSWLMAGCGAKHVPSESPSMYYGEEAETYAPSSKSMRSQSARDFADADVEGAMMEPQGSVMGAPSSAPAEPESRMVHYNGYAKLRVTTPDETLDVLAERAESAGGYVESMGQRRVTLRIPVDDFQRFFEEEVLELGDVLDKSLTAQDVTEAYASLDLRLRTARASRERLQKLLAKATEEEDKLRILQQIRRLTEQIDDLEMRTEVLARLASFSRITVELVPRDAFAHANARAELAGFEWIARLSPFSRALQAEGNKYVLPVPDGLVKLDDRGVFSAESADGAAFWASRHKMIVDGTATFWANAVEARLADEFAEAERSIVGPFEVLRFVEPSDDPYVYVVALRTEGRRLFVVEAYYPTTAQEDRYRQAVEQALSSEVSS